MPACLKEYMFNCLSLHNSLWNFLTWCYPSGLSIRRDCKRIVGIREACTYVGSIMSKTLSCTPESSSITLTMNKRGARSTVNPKHFSRVNNPQNPKLAIGHRSLLGFTALGWAPGVLVSRHVWAGQSRTFPWLHFGGLLASQKLRLMDLEHSGRAPSG